MPKRPAVALLPAFLILSLAAVAPERAMAITCQTIGGGTVCTDSDSLVCQSVNGRTICTHGSGTTCETVGDRTICRSNGSSPGTLSIEPGGQGLSIQEGGIDLRIR